MKAKILNKALSLILPHFVENFDKKSLANLNENQKIVQSDLLLKSDFFLFLGLPFLIDSGSIKEFSISIDQNNFVLINISNVEIACTITRISETQKSSSSSLKNKIIKKFLSNINFSFVFTNVTFHINTNYDLKIPKLNLDSTIKSTSINNQMYNYVSLIFRANNFSFHVKDKIFFDSSFNLTIDLPTGSNHEKQIIFKSNELNINLTSETVALFISFIKNIFNNASNSHSNEFITLSILDEDNNLSAAPSNENLEEEDENISNEINIGDMTNWQFNFELESISIQIEDETKVVISNSNFQNDLFSISKISITNSVENSIQYSLSFIEINFNTKEKNLIIHKIDQDKANELININQIHKEKNFLTSKKNENENKLDFYADQIEFNGSFEFFLNWIFIQLKNVDLLLSILFELASNDQPETDITNSSSFFTETTEIYDYSNESSVEQSINLSSTSYRNANSNPLVDFLKKFLANAYSIGVTFPLFKMNFDSGFSSHFSVHFFFSLKKRGYQIIGSDCHLSFRDYEPISTKLSFQVSVQKNLINVLLSPSDFRFTEDESLLLFYGVFSEVKKLLDKIQALDLKKRNLKKKGFIFLSTKRLKMTIVTFNLILCKNALIPNIGSNEKCLRKNAFLMISSDDISLSAISLKDRIAVHFKCLPSFKVWNAKTSFWDFVVNPFHLNVSVGYKNGIVHFDAEIPSSIEFNVTPLLFDCLLPKCSDSCDGIDLSKFSPTNLTLESLKKRTEDIKQKYLNCTQFNTNLNTQSTKTNNNENTNNDNTNNENENTNNENENTNNDNENTNNDNENTNNENENTNNDNFHNESKNLDKAIIDGCDSSLTGESEVCYGSESVFIYNGFGYPIPINIINEMKPSKASSMPAFIKIDDKNDDEVLPVSLNTVTDEEHRKINQIKKDSNSSNNLINDTNSNDANSNLISNDGDDMIVLENEETKLIPNATIDSTIFFPSLNEMIKISHIKCEYIIHNEMVIVPSFKKQSDPSYGKLIKLFPRFEMHNMTKFPLRFALIDNNELDMNYRPNCLTISPNGRIPLNEIQCRKRIAIIDEKEDLKTFSLGLNKYSSNLTDKRSNYFLIKLYSNSNNNKKNIKKDNDINHLNERNVRENLLMSFNYFLFSTIPNAYEYTSQNYMIKKSLALKLSNPVSAFNKVLQVRPLFAVRNDLPFEVICTFISDLKNYVQTVSVSPEETINLDDFNSSLIGIQFTACVASLGISKTINTQFKEIYTPDNNSFSISQKVTPFTQILQKEIIEITSKSKPNEILTSFYMTLNYCEDTGQFVFYLYSPVILVNKTNVQPLYINDGQSIYEFNDSNIPISENQKIFPTYIINRPIMSNESISLSISAQEEGPFVLLPQMSQFLNIFAGKDVIYPFYIEYRKMNEFVTYYEVRPRLSILNKMPFDLIFSIKTQQNVHGIRKSESNESEFHFVVMGHEEKTVIKCRNDISFSISSPGYRSIDEFIIETPMSTVFRLSNDDDDEKIVHYQLDKNENYTIGHICIENSNLTVTQSYYVATFEPANVWMPCSTLFVIVNNIPNYPIHAQQCEESMPIRISPNSTSLFPFDSPFSTPVVMVTIAGKSQLVPLRNEIKATLFPFKVGCEKIYADLIVLSSSKNKSVQALIIGYQPYYYEKVKQNFVFNHNIKTYNFTFNLIVKELLVSFFNENLEEFILLSLKLLRAKMTSNQLDFSVDSLQVDDQISFVKDAVVFKSRNCSSANSVKETKQTNSTVKNEEKIDDENDDENQFNSELISKVNWPLNPSSKSFIQFSIMFDFSLLNAQSFYVLVQPFDVVVDPTFVSDFLIYFSRLFDRRKFLVPNCLIYLQDFIIYPMNAHVLCKEIPKRKRHFSPEFEGNDFHCKFNRICNEKVGKIDHRIHLGKFFSHNLRNLLLFPFKPEKKCSVAFSSLVCHDLNISLASLFDILSRHFGFFLKNALSYLSSTIYTEKPDVSLSLFQASFVVSEFYDVSCSEIGNSFVDKNENENMNSKKSNNKDLTSNLGVNSYLDSIIRITNLNPTDVFPVFSCSSNMIVEYKTIYLIVQDSSSNLHSSSSSSLNLLQTNKGSKIVDSNSNLDLFSSSSSLSNYRFDLGNRISPQKLFVMNKVQFLATEMIGIETLVKKSIINQNEKLKFEKIYFLDYCGLMNTIIAVTENFFFIYALPSFTLISRFLLANIVDLKLNKNRLIIQLKKLSKWKSNDPVILIDLIDDDVAMQLNLIIQTLLAHQNKFV